MRHFWKRPDLWFLVALLLVVIGVYRSDSLPRDALSYDIRKDSSVLNYSKPEIRTILVVADDLSRVSPEEMLRLISIDKTRPVFDFCPGFKYGATGPWDFVVEFETKIDRQAELLMDHSNFRAYYGIGAEFKDSPGYKEDLFGTVMITKVYQGSPAEKAGLQPGDRILEIDGQFVDDSVTVRGIIDNWEKRAETVKLSVCHAATRAVETIEVPLKPMYFIYDQATDSLRPVSSSEALAQDNPARFVFTLYQKDNFTVKNRQGKQYGVNELKLKTSVNQGNNTFRRLQGGRYDDLSKVLLEAANSGLVVKIRGLVVGISGSGTPNHKGFEELQIDLLVLGVEIQK